MDCWSKINEKGEEAARGRSAQKSRIGLPCFGQKIYELSGGEAQRVALAKVILKDPPLILADELTAALDPETSQEVIDLLLTLKNQERIIIIATHNPVIWEKADEVVKLN